MSLKLYVIHADHYNTNTRYFIRAKKIVARLNNGRARRGYIDRDEGFAPRLNIFGSEKEKG